MKHKTAILLIICLVVSAIGIVFFNLRPENRLPPDGLYFIEHKSYLAFQESDEKIIPLNACFVNKNISKNRELILEYSNLSLVTDEGLNYYFLLSDKEKDIFMGIQDGEQYTDRFIEQMLIIDASNWVTNMQVPICFTSFNYIDDKGESITKNIGRIEIESVLEPTGAVAVLSQRLEWTNSILPTFATVDYAIENKTNSNLVVGNLFFGSIEINLAPSSFSLEPMQYKEVSADVILNNEAEGAPAVYIMKPKFNAIFDGNEQFHTVSNISIEKYVPEGVSLSEYFYKNKT